MSGAETKGESSSSPLIVYHVMSFNRLTLIRNLLISFQLCNVYSNYKFVISDYGSTDGSREFLRDYASNNSRLEIIFDDEKRHYDYLKTLNLAPKNKNQKLAVIGALFRNEVRKKIKGDLFFDLADDHQFIRRGNWVADFTSVFNHRINLIGKDDITGITTRAFLLNRHFKKANQPCAAQKTREAVEYFVYDAKPYDVYSVMRRSTFEKIGPFLEIGDLTDAEEIRGWQNDTMFINFYPDYCARSAALGYKRVALKFPYVVEFPNDIIPKIKSNSKSTLVPIFGMGDMEQEFSGVDRPVSSDEIFFSQGITDVQAPINRIRRNIFINLKKIGYRFKSN